ncbi:phage head spike fiber domain-containing protein [Pseudogemmobacter bohemicus]|uniref:phage head spike fiber domain-containing protein n=1 Tax=Pseudogemmobacter bohemicus TaxID=2250708 RepID=UPI000DD38632|nr:hypothetical protein [Pseudogemmobacter bohemicus]
MGGLWYDPTQARLWQTATGVVAQVAAAGQQVAIVPDRSQDGALGPELSAAEYTISTANQPVHTAAVEGLYRFDMEIVSGDGRARQQGTQPAIAGTLTEPPAATEADLYARPGSLLRINTNAAAGFVCRPTLRLIAGYHASQEVALARPATARWPRGGRRNLLTYSEQYAQPVWTKNLDTTVADNQAIAPDGRMTAARLTLGPLGAASLQRGDFLQPGTYTVSAWVRSGPGFGPSSFTMATYSASELEQRSPVITTTSDWARQSWTVTVGAVSSVYPVINRASAGSKTLQLWVGADRGRPCHDALSAGHNRRRRDRGRGAKYLAPVQ